MRRVIIQIVSIFFGIFFLITGSLALYYNLNISFYMLLTGFLYGIVAIKFMMFRTRSNMFFITLFLFLALLLNTFIIFRFDFLIQDKEMSYIFYTLPMLLKDFYLVASSVLVYLAATEFLSTGNID